MKLVLTRSALLEAERAGIAAPFEKVSLPGECMTGDLVSLKIGVTEHHFMVIRRRWIVTEEGATLEVTLDHPPRPGGR
ncbi:hypothetical protein [Aquamicrobium ahrensii]|uniref:Uncharacterized protein n=1 Tax=Aquamicrobium ahrensii TaxID=469551 RepID=A0ABV2KJK4_9HYPH